MLNKLRPNLREAITLKADVPLNRRDLVAMAQRIENTARGRGNSRMAVEEAVRKDHCDGRAVPKKRRDQKGPHSRQPVPQEGRRTESAGMKPDLSHVVCYGCGKKGHYKTGCPSNPQGASAAYPQRKVGVSDERKPDLTFDRRERAKKGKGRGKAHPST